MLSFIAAGDEEGCAVAAQKALKPVCIPTYLGRFDVSSHLAWQKKY